MSKKVGLHNWRLEKPGEFFSPREWWCPGEWPEHHHVWLRGWLLLVTAPHSLKNYVVDGIFPFFAKKEQERSWAASDKRSNNSRWQLSGTFLLFAPFARSNATELAENETGFKQMSFLANWMCRLFLEGSHLSTDTFDVCWQTHGWLYEYNLKIFGSYLV